MNPTTTDGQRFQPGQWRRIGQCYHPARSIGASVVRSLKQPTLLSEAGFEVPSSSASYDADFHEGMGWSIGPLITQPGR